MSEVDDLRARIRAVAAQYHAIRADLGSTREQLKPLLVEALRHAARHPEELKQKDVIADSGLTREYVRQLARDAGIKGRI